MGAAFLLTNFVMLKNKNLNPKKVAKEFDKRACERNGVAKVLSNRFDKKTNEEFDHACKIFIKKYFPKKIENVLDVGVGIGRLAKYFSQISDQLVGVDFSKEMLTVAKKELKTKKNVTLILNDILDVEFLPNYFDLGIISLILKHNNAKRATAIINKFKKWCQCILLIEHVSGGSLGSDIAIVRKDSWYLDKLLPFKPVVIKKIKRHNDVILFCILK